MVRVSICMATYNGGAYIREQLDSILPQMTSEDELIISDDGSTDGTIEIIKSYGDNRVRLLHNKGARGHVNNFANSLTSSRGCLIALSDQDDIWVECRLQRMVSLLEATPDADLLVGDFVEFNQKGEILPLKSLGITPRNALIQLLVVFAGQAKYFGATFLFRRRLLGLVLPIPTMVEAHDIWIAMNACLRGGVVHMQDSVLKRRIHGANLTPRKRRSVIRILWSRLRYAAALGLTARRKYLPNAYLANASSAD